MVRIGLIGCGGMGTRHSSCYTAIENAKVVAVADVRKELADEKAKEFGCKAYYSGKELLDNAKDIDAVDICLPTFLHVPHAIEAMERGLDVFIEKPVCLTKEEAPLLLEAQKKTGRKVMVGQAVRFWDEYAWLKDTADSGKYGKLLSGIFNRVSPIPTWGWDNWFLDGKRCGSVALDLHVHDVDFMRYMMGEPESFSSEALRDADGQIDHIITIYQYKDGVKFMIEGAWGYPTSFPFQMAYRVKFEKATIVFDGVTVNVYPVDGEGFAPDIPSTCDLEATPIGNLSAIGAYFYELSYFVDCVEKNLPIEKATLDDAIKSALLVLAETEDAGGVYSK